MLPLKEQFSVQKWVTSLGDIVHGVVFVISHESKYWEDDEAGVETRQAVDDGNKQGIPEIKQYIINNKMQSQQNTNKSDQSLFEKKISRMKKKSKSVKNPNPKKR